MNRFSLEFLYIIEEHEISIYIYFIFNIYNCIKCVKYKIKLSVIKNQKSSCIIMYQKLIKKYQIISAFIFNDEFSSQIHRLSMNDVYNYVIRSCYKTIVNIVQLLSNRSIFCSNIKCFPSFFLVTNNPYYLKNVDDKKLYILILNLKLMFILYPSKKMFNKH